MLVHPSAKWAMRLPVPVEFGPGVVDTVPRYLTGIQRVLVVTGRQAMKSSGVTDRVTAMLRAELPDEKGLLAVIPTHEMLQSPTLREIADQLGAEVLYGADQLDKLAHGYLVIAMQASLSASRVSALASSRAASAPAALRGITHVHAVYGARHLQCARRRANFNRLLGRDLAVT